MPRRKLEAMEPVFVEIGAIVQVSQQLEFGLKYAIALLRGLEGEEFSDAEFDDVFDTLAKRTLGRLIDLFAKHTELSVGFSETLADALDARNEAVHGYFADNIESLASVQGRKDAIPYLRVLWKKVSAGVIAVDQVVPELMALSGINAEALSIQAKRAIEP